MNDDTQEERKLKDLEQRVDELEVTQPAPRRKPKTNYSAATMPDRDKCQTPSYALEPLLPYIPKNQIIWEPAVGEGFLVQGLRQYGYTRIIESDILTGDDFFTANPVEMVGWFWNMIVTNPPFSLKYKWLERCYELGYPFALLMPSDTLFAASANKLFQKYGIEIIIMNPRVDFMMPYKGWEGKGSDFSTSWFTWKLNIGQMITFADISEAKRKFKASLKPIQNVLD